MNYEALIIDGPYLAHRSLTAPYNLTTTTGLNATMLHSFSQHSPLSQQQVSSSNSRHHLGITWNSILEKTTLLRL